MRSAAALALSSDPVFDEGTYLRIKETLLSYSDIQVRGGWPTLPADAKLAPGASGPDVALLRRHLVIGGDLPADQEAGDVYDAAVAEGVKRFQLRHGLDATGTVGAQTLKALNVPVGDRIKQLEASLERLLGMDFMFAERYVVVNIPAAFVEAVANGKVERRYRVIVGKIDKPSPTLYGLYHRRSISIRPGRCRSRSPRPRSRTTCAGTRAISAACICGSSALTTRRSIRRASIGRWTRSPNFTVRQDAGNWNALGNLKIDMPNPYSVYMHDTDTRKLFSRRLSLRFARLHAGRQCARSRRLDFAGRPAGLGSRRDRCRHRRRPDQIINLPHKIPVAWVYLTGWVTRDGTVEFRDDVYKHDEQLDRNGARRSGRRRLRRAGAGDKPQAGVHRQSVRRRHCERGEANTRHCQASRCIVSGDRCYWRAGRSMIVSVFLDRTHD